MRLIGRPYVTPLSTPTEVLETYAEIYWVISIFVLIMDLEQEYIDIAKIAPPIKDLVLCMACKSDSDVQLLFETFLYVANI